MHLTTWPNVIICVFTVARVCMLLFFAASWYELVAARWTITWCHRCQVLLPYHDSWCQVSRLMWFVWYCLDDRGALEAPSTGNGDFQLDGDCFDFFLYLCVWIVLNCLTPCNDLIFFISSVWIVLNCLFACSALMAPICVSTSYVV